VEDEIWTLHEMVIHENVTTNGVSNEVSLDHHAGDDETGRVLALTDHDERICA
jgi:hypothetical protein